MLTVKCFVQPSKIHGLGLFASEKIAKGTLIWRFDEQFDIYFTQEEVEKMSEEKKAFIKMYSPLSVVTKKYCYSIDDSRFMNHSSINKNMDVVDADDSLEKIAIANRDIQAGEELLCDYREFDEVDQHDETGYLNT